MNGNLIAEAKSSVVMTPSTRNAAATRAAILTAAQIEFSNHDYDRVGIRAVAGAAGVDSALVNRYFGSKEGLFREVVDSTFSSPVMGGLLDGARATFGERTARHLAEKRAHGPQEVDPLRMILHAAASPRAAAIVRECMTRHMTAPFATWLGGPAATARAGLLLSYILGYCVARLELDVPHLGDEYALKLLAGALQAVVDA